MRHALTCSLFFLAIACGSSSVRPTAVAEPGINVRPVGPVFFGSGRTAPATFEVDITNQAQTPLTVRAIQLSSPGMAQYAIQPIRRTFNDTVAPGETKTLTIFATAVTTISNPTEPLTLRTIVTLQANGQTFQEIRQN